MEYNKYLLIQSMLSLTSRRLLVDGNDLLFAPTTPKLISLKHRGAVVHVARLWTLLASILGRHEFLHLSPIPGFAICSTFEAACEARGLHCICDRLRTFRIPFHPAAVWPILDQE